jgi:hypothetical protein
VSRQYQRRSRQALPPSATICSAGRRIPHIQQDLTLACRAQYRTGCGWSVRACPPARVPAGAVVVARRAWMFTGAAGAWNGGCSGPAVRLGSRSSGRSPISDVPASYGQPVVICNTASRPLAGTWPYPVCVSRRRTRHPRLRGRAHLSRFPSSHGPDATLRLDKFPIDVQPIYRPLRRVMWTTPGFLLCTGHKWRSPG